MKIDHIHFYVEDAAVQANWFIERLGCQRLRSVVNSSTRTEVLRNGSVYFVLSSPLTPSSPCSAYLEQHPAGVVDIALSVEALDSILTKATLIDPVQSFAHPSGAVRWAKVAGWGDLTHTLIENKTDLSFCDILLTQGNSSAGAEWVTQDRSSRDASLVPTCDLGFTQVDHVVLNVPAGTLSDSVNWYRTLFDLQTDQAFNIQTQHSGLKSQVLTSKRRELYFNINEPSSANSQIQRFLEDNRGSGIQHIALKTNNIVKTVADLRRKGLAFLSVPAAYYAKLKQQFMPALSALLQPTELAQIQVQNILVDGVEKGDSVLLQIFTQPIFREPTFFLS